MNSQTVMSACRFISKLSAKEKIVAENGYVEEYVLSSPINESQLSTSRKDRRFSVSSL